MKIKKNVRSLVLLSSMTLFSPTIVCPMQGAFSWLEAGVNALAANIEAGVEYLGNGLGTVVQAFDHDYRSLTGDAFEEENFDQLMNVKKYSDVLAQLRSYFKDDRINNDLNDVESNRIKNWMYQKADVADYGLLFWAAKICLAVGEEHRGLLFILEADAVLFKNIGEQEHYSGIRKDLFELTTHPENEWPNQELLKRDLAEWKARVLTPAAE